MGAYLARRVLLAVPTLCLVLVASFVLVRLTPGDPALAYLEDVRVTQAALTQVRHQLGLDRSLPLQLAYYAGRVARGDLGRSYFTHQRVVTMIADRFQFTLELALAATALSVALGVPLGVLAATRRNTAVDYLVSTAAVIAYSMPGFWVGLLLILTFADWLPWFPVIGTGTPGHPADLLYHLVLPAVSVGLARVALLARITRSSMLDVVHQAFVQTARSKGLAERRVLFRHALRNALIPILTILGLGVGHLLGGAIVAETVFVRAGLGMLLVQAMQGRDYPVIQGTLLIFAVGIIVANMVVDALYALADPRIRYG